MQVAITITEGLAELKTLDKRIEKKRQTVIDYLCRPDSVKDPLEKDGGSEKFVQQEKQSIDDLETRKIAIRRQIAKTNEATPVSIATASGKVFTRSIAEWLTWRKEIAPVRQKFNAQVKQRLDQLRRESLQKGVNVVAVGEVVKPTDIIVNLSEKELVQESQQIDEILGVLDGQLSLKNATVKFEV